MQSHSKETKFNHTTLQNCLKDQEVKMLPTKLMKLKKIQDEQQTEQEVIKEQLDEDHSTVVTEASSSSALNPQLQVSAAVCTTQPTITVSTKSNLTKIEQLPGEFPDFYYCPVGNGLYCKVCVTFAGLMHQLD